MGKPLKRVKGGKGAAKRFIALTYLFISVCICIHNSYSLMHQPCKRFITENRRLETPVQEDVRYGEQHLASCSLGELTCPKSSPFPPHHPTIAS